MYRLVIVDNEEYVVDGLVELFRHIGTCIPDIGNFKSIYAGVKQVFYMDLFAQMKQFSTRVEQRVEAYMSEMGIDTTILRPVALMEILTEKSFYPAIAAWHMMPKLLGA
jgi:hypothetical protein